MTLDEERFKQILREVIDTDIRPYIHELVNQAVQEIPTQVQRFLLTKAEQGIREFVSQELQKSLHVSLTLKPNVWGE